MAPRLRQEIVTPLSTGRMSRRPNLSTGGADRRLQTVGVGHVGLDCDRLIAGELRGFLPGPGIDLGNSYSGAFARKQDGGGAADPGARAGMKATLPASRGI
jgi:hypothetical protein